MTPVGFHATTVRVAQYIADGSPLDPGASERFSHVFAFERLAQAKDFTVRYSANFHDTGPSIIEFDASGLPWERDPQVPSLDGAWRCAEEIPADRLIATYEMNRAGDWTRTRQR